MSIGPRQTKPRVQIRSFRVSVATDVLLVARLEEECAGPPTGRQYVWPLPWSEPRSSASSSCLSSAGTPSNTFFDHHDAP